MNFSVIWGPSGPCEWCHPPAQPHNTGATFYYISSHRSSHVYIIHTAYLEVVFKISREKQLEAARKKYNAMYFPHLKTKCT